MGSSTMTVRCGLDLPVNDENDSKAWLTSEACPNGVPAGTVALEVLNACRGGCPFAEKGFAKQEEPAAEAAPELPAEPVAEPELPAAEPPPPAEPVAEAAPPPAPAPDLPPQPPAGESKICVVKRDEHGNEVPVGSSPPPTDPPSDTVPASVPLAGTAPLPATQEVEAAPPPPAPTPPPEAEPPKEEPAPPPAQPADSLAAAALGLPAAAPAPPAQPEPQTGPPATAPPQESTPVTAFDPPDIDVGDIILPGGTKFVPDDEASVDIDKAMDTIEGMIGGPSSGGYSSHVLADHNDCKYRAFLKYVMGIKPRQPKIHFAWGSLFHACLAMKYQYGVHRMYEPIEAAILAGAPGMARDVRTLVDAMHDKFAKIEQDTWCPRAVEHNTVYWLEPVRINGKRVRIPISLRIDLLLSLKAPGEACPGLGPAPQGVVVVDHKTSSGLTIDLIKHYSNDWQLKYYALGYKMSGMEESFGPLKGIMINLAVKRKKIDPDKHFFRQWVTMRDGVLEEFLEQEVKPTAIDFHERLTSDNVMDPNLWPKRTMACVGKWGPCDFLPLCDSGNLDNQIDFIRDESEIYVGKLEDKLLPPPKSKGTTQMQVDDAKEAAKVEKKRVQQMVAQAAGLSFQVSQEEPWTAIDKKFFLVEGHTEKGVRKALTEKIKEVTAPHVAAGTQYAQQVTGLESSTGVMLKFVKSGLKWSYSDIKGTTTWKMVADAICDADWFNLANL